MANTYSAVTTGFNVLDPNNLDGTPFFKADSTGVYSNGTLIQASDSSGNYTAFATGGQTNATLLTTSYNVLTVVATNGDSVKLPVPVSLGETRLVKNAGAAIAAIFPNTGCTINALAANLSIDLPVGAQLLFTASSLTAWQTQIVLVSLSPTTQTGNLVIKASASAGDTQTTITNASQAAARTYTIPDAGVSTSTFLMADNATTQTIATGNLTLGAAAGTLQATNVNAGVSGTAGLISVFPVTASKGSTTFTATANTGNTVTNINTAAQAAARTYTIPDTGNSTDTFTLAGGIGGTLAARCTTQTNVTSSTTLVNITGLTVNVTAAGQYAFQAHLATTTGASGGTKAAPGGTATWTSINTTTYSYTASAVAVNTGTTATPGTSIAGSTALNIGTIIEGTVVINAAGTFTMMFAQNASDGTQSSVFVNSYMTLTRIA